MEEITPSAFSVSLQEGELLGLPIKTVDFIREVTWGPKTGEEIFAGGHPWDIADEMARNGLNLNDPDWRSNPSKVKWSQFINDERYADEHIGIYLEPDAIHVMHKSEYSGLYGDYSSFSNEFDELEDPGTEDSESEAEE